SIAGKEGVANICAYSAAKAGVIGLAKAMAKELCDAGVTVNCIAPAMTETPLLDGMTQEFISTMKAKIPMGRFVYVDEIAELAEGGLDVTLVDAWQEHVAAIKAHGIRIVGVGGERAIKVKATADAGEIRRAEVVLFQCKAFANEAAAQSARHLFGGGAVAITFQNGLGNEEALGRVLGAANVIGGLTAQAGLVEAPGVVRNFGDLPTYIGEMARGPR